jgi:hypothetical protein
MRSVTLVRLAAHQNRELPELALVGVEKYLNQRLRKCYQTIWQNFNIVMRKRFYRIPI